MKVGAREKGRTNLAFLRHVSTSGGRELES